MEEIVLNELGHDGMRRLKVISDRALIAPPPTPPHLITNGEGSLLRLVPEVARGKMQVKDSADAALGIFSLEIEYPVFGPCDVAIFTSKKFRRLFFVNFAYGSRVSECIELARDAFFAGTCFVPTFAFIRCVPSGAEEWIDVHGLILVQAEWMPERCVAVGGW